MFHRGLREAQSHLSELKGQYPQDKFPYNNGESSFNYIASQSIDTPGIPTVFVAQEARRTPQQHYDLLEHLNHSFGKQVRVVLVDTASFADPKQFAEGIHALAQKIQAPMIAIGYSWGGANLHAYTQLHPEDNIVGIGYVGSGPINSPAYQNKAQQMGNIARRPDPLLHLAAHALNGAEKIVSAAGIRRVRARREFTPDNQAAATFQEYIIRRTKRAQKAEDIVHDIERASALAVGENFDRIEPSNVQCLLVQNPHDNIVPPEQNGVHDTYANVVEINIDHPSGHAFFSLHAATINRHIAAFVAHVFKLR